WTLYWGGLHAAGGLSGAALGLGAGWVVAIVGEFEEQLILLQIGGAVLGMFVGIFVLRQLHYFLFFLTGAMLALLAGLLGLRVARGMEGIALPDMRWQMVILAVASALGGVLMVMLSRSVVALVTGFIGSLLVVAGIPHPIAPLFFLPLFLGSFFLQTGILLRLAPKKADEDDD
ncbi:MAG: hypothetical protein V2A74_02265, partial [bacterium]